MDPLRRDARRLLAAHSRGAGPSPEARVGRDGVLWRRMAELGWMGLACEPELAAIMEELGRAVAQVPFLSTVALAGTALKLAGDTRWLPDLETGALTATLALAGDARVADGLLSGTMTRVVDGDTAELVIVATPDGLFVAAPSARRPLPTLDATRPLADLVFAGAPATRLADPSLLPRVLDRAVVALACEQLGGAGQCLDLAVEYAKTRVQFNRPIGSFQAIKHKLADLYVAVETSRSACAWAARDGGPLAAATAKAWCSDAYCQCAAESLQIHGGIGFTWAHEAHLHLRRARAGRALLGTPDAHREAVAREILA